MKIAAIAKVIKDRGSCRLYRVHGSDDLETKFYIGTNSEIYSLELRRRGAALSQQLRFEVTTG